MRSLSMFSFLILATSSLAFAADKSDEQRIAEGEILLTTHEQPGSDIPVVQIRATIDAAPERVWALIDKCDGYKKVMPRMSESEELERNGNKVKCRTKISVPWPMSDLEAVTWAEHIITPGKKWVRKWTLESGSFDKNDGSWVITPYGDDGKQTLVVYEAATKPKSSVPGFIRNIAQQSSLPDIIHNLRKALVKKG